MRERQSLKGKKMMTVPERRAFYKRICTYLQESTTGSVDKKIHDTIQHFKGLGASCSEQSMKNVLEKYIRTGEVFVNHAVTRPGAAAGNAELLEALRAEAAAGTPIKPMARKLKFDPATLKRLIKEHKMKGPDGQVYNAQGKAISKSHGNQCT